MLLSLTLIFIGLIIYAYFGYPLFMILISAFVNKNVKKAENYPAVALVIAAYNEEDVITQKVNQSLALNYPEEKLKVYVVSDASSDKTDDKVRSINSPRVQLIRIEGRLGKTEARNQALKRITEEIIVFSDATTEYHPNSVRELVKNFSDSSVGMVSGQLIYKVPQGSSMGFGQKLFWRFENIIKTAQTKLGTLTGSLGCMTAFRRELYTDLPPNIIEDFTGPLLMIQKGYRVVYEKEALCFEEATMKSKQEWKMRVRVIRGGMTGLIFARSILNPFKFPGVSFQLLSHKVSRWLVPVFAILALFFNLLDVIVESTSSLSFTLLGLQCLFYLIVVLSFMLEKTNVKAPLLRIFQYLFVVNLASLVAIYKILTTELEATWETERKGQKA
ncbi:MAG: glycosyl transferase family 2 [Halobacteriovoraceae bacterium]|nr:glycosyl transferase family 2 [Halobacteriovoraceae bacterium]|tara:strand:+ start:13749 stop:14912 length:1164 start_codon:yes stop_codon:yes gene_type:complete